MTLTIAGPSPVTLVTVDLMGDGHPAWYVPLADGRGDVTLAVGPPRRAGRYQVAIEAADSRGCTGSIGFGPFVTVQP